MKILFRGNEDVYSEVEIDNILKTFKEKQDSLRNQEDIKPYYAKSMSTFKYLQEEQAIDTSRFHRIRELYKEITLENTLKLLLRCKIAYDNRRRLLAVFLCHGEWERQCGKLQKLLDADAVGGRRSFSDEGKQRILEQFAKMKRKAESLLKRLIEFTKNENKGSVAQATPKNEAEQAASDQPEPIRALQFKGKRLGRKVSETPQ